MKSPLPPVGTPGWVELGGDAYPVTLVKISKGGNKVVVQYDDFRGDEDNGHDYYGIQKWDITRNENGSLGTFNWSPLRNCYVGNGSYDPGSCYFGSWHAKQDPNF